MISVFVIGFGRIAQRHIQVILDSPNFHLVGIAETDQAKIAIAEQLGAPVFRDFEHGLAKTIPDLTVICTESGNHVAHAIKAMSFGGTLLIEKPLALTLAGGQSVISEAKKRNVRLNVVQQNRLNRPVQSLKAALITGALGTLFSAHINVLWNRGKDYYDQARWRGTWELDGGVLSNQANHHIDLATFFFGRPKRVYGRSKNTRGFIDSEDLSIGCMDFESGLLLTHHITTAAEPENIEAGITVVGELGVVKISGIAANEIEIWSAPEVPDSDKSEQVADVYGNGHERLYEHLFSNWQNLPTEITSAESALVTVETVARLYDSAFENMDFASNEDKFNTFGSREKDLDF